MTSDRDRSPVTLPVEGYARNQSVIAGDTVELCCSTTADRVLVDVARIGAAREVVHRAVVRGTHQDVPDDASSRGCGWEVTHHFRIPADWRSGYYEVRLSDNGPDTPHDRTGRAYFVVRPDAGTQKPRYALALTTSTWNAYNAWGGTNLYNGGTRVSFQRPMLRGFLDRPDETVGRFAATGAGGDPDLAALVDYSSRHGLDLWCAAAGWAAWERRFVAWAERLGYEFGYLTSVDLHADPSALDGYRAYLSVGHDEYWSWEMRDVVEKFVAAGGSAAFFSGNTAFWQVRFDGPDGDMIGWKAEAERLDPVVGTASEHLMTGPWCHPLVGRPENEMTGVSFSAGGYSRLGGALQDASGGYVVNRANHWVFDGTGLTEKDEFGTGATVVGYECDGCLAAQRDGRLHPTHDDGAPSSLEILAYADAQHWTLPDDVPEPLAGGIYVPPVAPGASPHRRAFDAIVDCDQQFRVLARDGRGYAIMAVHRSGDGSVFTTGCTDWAHGLGRDPAVDRITTNVLDRLGTRRR